MGIFGKQTDLLVKKGAPEKKKPKLQPPNLDFSVFEKGQGG